MKKDVQGSKTEPNLNFCTSHTGICMRVLVMDRGDRLQALFQLDYGFFLSEQTDEWWVVEMRTYSPLCYAST